MDLERLRHSTAHVMAAAVCRLYENVQLDIGPATEDGFYYDFDLPKRLSSEDLPRIEKEMAAIVAARLPFERVEMSRADAETFLKSKGQRFKLERLADIPAGETISFYKCGDFTDLCRGPHVETTGDIKGFRLVSIAGSYFRGNERNPMLQRIYGVAAGTQGEVEEILRRVEEARQRDHRKLGKELGLFSIEEEVGPGLVHWHPRGGRIRTIVEDYWRKEHFKAGYEIVYTPHVGQGHLWQTSGHLEFFKENMYSAMDVDGVDYYVKPMNCPFHIQIYEAGKRSYRDLPLRLAELGTVYRYEKSGVLQGLLRVRGFTQDDAHIFCTPEQIEDEISSAVKFAIKTYRAFGFNDIVAYLSTKPGKAVGEVERWDQATKSLEKALKAEAIPFTVDEGGGAFYGPKIDLKIKDLLKREWQTSTIQFDFNLPARFGIVYVGEDGKEHQPYMVHRALLGSLERFFGLLIEHYGGAFPFWLAPEQVRVLLLTDKQAEYGGKVVSALTEAGIRVEIDRKSEKIGAKIRRAQAEKVPYMFVVGQKEADGGNVALRSRSGGDEGVVPLADAVDRLRKENVPG